MWIPFLTLLGKEVTRFTKVWMHTLLAPVLTGGLYLFVFGEALSKHLPVYEAENLALNSGITTIDRKQVVEIY